MSRAKSMRPWLRRSLILAAALLLLLIGAALWLAASFDGERVKRAAIDWMRTHHARELAFDGPITLRFWPQLALTAQGVRLSEPGQPQQSFATIEEAALALRLEPLLARREIEIDRVMAKGVRLSYRRGADGRRNIDDLLARAAGGGQPRTGSRQVLIESIELVDAELQVADALAAVEGRFVVQQLSLAPYGPGLLSPLHLEAQAELQQPLLNASLVLDAGLQLLPAPEPGALPVVRLVKSGLQLRGKGYDFEDLDARMQADAIRLEYGAAAGVTDSDVDLDNVQLQFSGARLGWRIDVGQLGLGAVATGRTQPDARARATGVAAAGAPV